MARQPTIPKAKKPEAPKKCCRECAHSYDWQNRSIDTHRHILCRCPYDEKSGRGELCKFLSDPECEHFKDRPQNAPAYAEAY